MEKVVYLLWREPTGVPGGEDADLLGPVAGRLLSLGARGLQVNPAAGIESRFASAAAPGPAAVIGLWVDSASESFRRGFDDAVRAASTRHAAYLVTESEPLPNRAHPPGRPTPGLAQIALLRRPDRLDRQAWLRAWQDDHTPVALATQSTFRYVQNVVVRALTDGAPPYEGIVEECFPEEAAADLHVFFDAEGDDARLSANMGTMVDSCARFMDLDRTEVVWTREHVIRPPRATDD